MKQPLPLYRFSRGSQWVFVSGGVQPAVEAALALITADLADVGIPTVHVVLASEVSVVILYSLLENGDSDEAFSQEKATQVVSTRGYADSTFQHHNGYNH